MKRITIIFLIFIISFYMVFNVLNIKNYSVNNNTLAVANINNKKSSMFVWNIYNLDYTALDEMVDYLNLDTLYIGNYNNMNDYKHSLLFNYASNKKLKSYYIYGEKYENQDQILIEIKNLIDKTSLYNENNSYKIEGLVIDSEFHTTDVYRNGDLETKISIFRKYVDIMKEAYEYAKSKDLKFIACIPSHYDKNISEPLLEELIRDCCDCIQIMNYTKKNSIVNIENEVLYAKAYNKKIESIAELQKPGDNGVTDNITFWNDGIDKCIENMEQIELAYNYDKLFFSYHAYSSGVELYKNIHDYSPFYDYELTIKNADNSSFKIDNLILTNGEDKIKGINVYDDTSNEYITYFYGVKYNTNYKLIDEDKNYSLEDNIVFYEQSDDRLKSEEKIFQEYIESDPDKEIEDNEIVDNNKEEVEENETIEDDYNEDLNIENDSEIKEEIKEEVNIEKQEEIIVNEKIDSNKIIVSYPKKENTIVVNKNQDNIESEKDLEETKNNILKEKIEKEEIYTNADEKVNSNIFKNTLLIILSIIVILLIIINIKLLLKRSN